MPVQSTTIQPHLFLNMEPRRRDVLVGDVTRPIIGLGWVVVAAETMAADVSITEVLDQARGRESTVPIRQLRFGSPIEIVVSAAPVISLSVPALATLIFGIKRLYSLDLELRTQREEQRARFITAKAIADQAQVHADALTRAANLQDAVERERMQQGLLAEIEAQGKGGGKVGQQKSADGSGDRRHQPTRSEKALRAVRLWLDNNSAPSSVASDAFLKELSRRQSSSAWEPREAVFDDGTSSD